MLATGLALTAVLLPLLIAAGPALVAAVLHYCPPGSCCTGYEPAGSRSTKQSPEVRGRTWVASDEEPEEHPAKQDSEG